jgi:hypothetical protein
MIHTIAERKGERRRIRRGERMKKFSLIVFHTQRVNNLQ